MHRHAIAIQAGRQTEDPWKCRVTLVWMTKSEDTPSAAAGNPRPLRRPPIGIGCTSSQRFPQYAEQLIQWPDF